MNLMNEGTFYYAGVNRYGTVFMDTVSVFREGAVVLTAKTLGDPTDSENTLSKRGYTVKKFELRAIG